MKKELVLTASLFAATLCFGQNTAQTGTVPYDSALAKKLGADEYGMKEYVMVILSTGQSKIGDRMNGIKPLRHTGKILATGPPKEKLFLRGLLCRVMICRKYISCR